MDEEIKKKILSKNYNLSEDHL